MKKFILGIVVIAGISLTAGAQTTGDQGSGGTHAATSGSSAQSSNGKTGKKSKGTTATTNQRKMYPSKKTGQSATPTGQEATGVNASNAANPKNAGKDSTQQQ